MTSINLISPRDSADEFNVRFREPITIKKNSKIYLNWAQFTRFNEIIFDNNQTITLSDLEFIPRVQPADGVTPIALTTNIINIPAVNPVTGRRAYTVQQLETTIASKLTDLIDANPELNIYSVISRLDTNRDQSSFLTGIFLDDNFVKLPITAFVKDNVNERGADDGDDPNGLSCVYFKNSATAASPHYDSYAMGTEHFFHFAAECMGNDAQVISGTFLKFKTNVDMNNQQGNISIGLYSKEFANEPTAFTGWVEKTTGGGATTTGGALNNPAIFTGNTQLNATSATAPNLKKAVLGSFLTVEITGVVNAARNTSQLKILVPLRTTGNTTTPDTWTSIDQNFRKMRQVFSTPLANVYTNGLNQAFEGTLIFYIATTDLDFLSATDRKVYFKLFKNVEDATANVTPIYDSKQHNIYYPQSFFTGLGNLNVGTADQKKAKVNSAIPFTPIVASQVQNEGWETITYKSFSKGASGATDQKPNTLLANYKLNFSEALGEFVGALTSGVLFPNVCEMDARFFYFEDIIESWKNDSFDIYLNGLPIKNYKNKENSSDGGYGKSLLASIPVPFLNGNSSEAMGARYALLTGLYQPSIKNELSLSNQEKTINSIQVQIKETNTEHPAEQLYQAHVCFTITDGEE